MNSCKAFIADLDGTLLNDSKEVGKRDIESLKILGEKGIVRIIATGRSLFSFREVIPDDYPLDYLVLAAGAGTYDLKQKKIIRSHFIEAQKVNELIQKLNLLKVDYQIRAKVPYSHKYYYRQFSELNPDFDRLNSIYKDYIGIIEERDAKEDATRIICIAQSIEIVQLIEEEFKEYSIIRATSPIDNQSVWMEIYPPGVNKGSAIDNLCKDLGFSILDTIAIGNDYNDIHMLDRSGKSFVVANAPMDLKAKYELTVTNNENPLTAVINELCLDKSQL